MIVIDCLLDTICVVYKKNTKKFLFLIFFLINYLCFLIDFLELVCDFQTDFYICGIAPLDTQLVLLGYHKVHEEDGTARRPQLYVIEPKSNDYSEICTDILTLRGYQDYKASDYHLGKLNLEFTNYVSNYFLKRTIFLNSSNILNLLAIIF